MPYADQVPSSSNAPAKRKWIPPAPPVKFTNPEEFDQKIDEYFDTCCGYQPVESIDPETGETKTIPQRVWINPPSVVGLANHLGCDYRTLLYINDNRYSANSVMTPELREKLVRSISRARQLIHEYTVQAALTNKSAQGPIFVLKNNFGWRDEQHISQETTIKREKIDLGKLSTDDLRQLQKLISAAQIQDAAEDGEYKDAQNE